MKPPDKTRMLGKRLEYKILWNQKVVGVFGTDLIPLDQRKSEDNNIVSL